MAIALKGGTLKNNLSIAISIAVHIFLYVAICHVGFEVDNKIENATEQYVDFGYEELKDEPVFTSKPIANHEETAPESTSDTKELQDNTSEVTGSKAEETKATSDSNSEVQSDKSQTVSETPVYKVKPKYPKEALLSGAEGYVELIIDIKEDGGVENIRVAGGDKVLLFESEARRAVNKWKYKPFQSENGTPTKKRKSPN